MCVHNRLDNCHEIFLIYNLYPGPSAKKVFIVCCWILVSRKIGSQLMLLLQELLRSYENEIVIMHEGASGGGKKSEMLEVEHREPDGRILLGTHIVTGGKNYLHLGRYL